MVEKRVQKMVLWMVEKTGEKKGVKMVALKVERMAEKRDYVTVV
jgi:hypothetical protein